MKSRQQGPETGTGVFNEDKSKAGDCSSKGAVECQRSTTVVPNQSETARFYSHLSKQDPDVRKILVKPRPETLTASAGIFKEDKSSSVDFTSRGTVKCLINTAVVRNDLNRAKFDQYLSKHKLDAAILPIPENGSTRYLGNGKDYYSSAFVNKTKNNTSHSVHQDISKASDFSFGVTLPSIGTDAISSRQVEPHHVDNINNHKIFHGNIKVDDFQRQDIKTKIQSHLNKLTTTFQNKDSLAIVAPKTSSGVHSEGMSLPLVNKHNVPRSITNTSKTNESTRATSNLEGSLVDLNYETRRRTEQWTKKNLNLTDSGHNGSDHNVLDSSLSTTKNSELNHRAVIQYSRHLAQDLLIGKKQ